MSNKDFYFRRNEDNSESKYDFRYFQGPLEKTLP